MTIFSINIDGRDIPARSGQTILQVCRENGINIPVLCYEPRLSPLGTCRLCTVEVEGPGLTISCSTMAAPGMVVRTASEGVIATRRARVEQLVADHYGDCLAPCRQACPAGIDVQGYITLVSRGAYQEAVDLIGESIPLPAVCGRICPHPCEKECRRSLVDDPIAINHLKRFASEHAAPPRYAVAPPSGFRVAVIGSGPAGLSAACFLALRGHAVTIFEAQPQPGGMLRYGIPGYRLPRDVLDREIGNILGLGIELKTGRRLGTDFTLQGLLQSDGFQAVFLATGAGSASRLNIPGEDLGGVIPGIEFLSRVAGGAPPPVGKRVAVIGGGNTAVDAARTALRLGATEVTLVYRRSRGDMPAIPSEVAEAEQEGIKLNFQAAPVRIEGAGRVDKLFCQRTAPGRTDASGRPSVGAIPGSDYALEADCVIVAAGQQPDLSFLDMASRVAAPGAHSQLVDENTGSQPGTRQIPMILTAMPGVFAGGDAVTGPATAIEAMAAGRKAALAIDDFLKSAAGSAPSPGPSPATKQQFNSVKGKLDEINKAEFAGIGVQRRQPAAEAPIASRRDFGEVVAGYNPAQAAAEAGRCLQCGCSAVDKCTLRTLATDYGVAAPPPKKDRYLFPVDRSNPFITRDDNKCVLCGVCTRTCRETIGAGALPTTFRAAGDSVMAPLSKTSCISCGECTAVCPVGAMAPARELKPTTEVTTVCPYCSYGCAVKLGVRGNTIVSARGDSSGANHGLLCVRGRFGWGYVNHPDRLRRPLVRKQGKLVPASWEEALDIAAAGFAAFRDRGPAVIGSNKILNEEAYLLGKFSRGPLAKLQGVPLQGAACLMVIGTDLSVSYPVLWQEVRRAVQNGLFLIAVDSRETELARMANLWLAPRPGTDTALIAGVINAAIQENILDPELLRQLETEYGQIKESVAGVTPARAEEITGINPDRIVDVAYSLVQNRPAMAVYGSGIRSDKNGAQVIRALENLAVITGNRGQPGSGVFPLMGQNNVYGAASQAIGPELLAGQSKALYVVGANPAVSLGRKGREALQKLDFLVVQDIFLTETAALADVVLAAASLAEKEGTVTNLGGAVQQVRRAISPVGDSREDWRIVCEIARRMGGRGYEFSNVKDIAAEMGRQADGAPLSAGQPPAVITGGPSRGPRSPSCIEETPTGNDPYHFNTRSMTARSLG